ncbi:AB hydrolase superfamily protein C1039.03 [Opitutia bacterium]|nr:AB hydrolase superfamily protein C1039.03 [Opitutae bacterium]
MRLTLALLTLCVALTAGAQEKNAKKKAGGYPPTIEGTKSETYRKVGDTELKVWIFDSRQKMTERPLSAIVFFFGGGWTGGSPTQFEPQSRHLASRGMIAIVADYRVKTRQDAKPADCVSDAKACVRWVRANAVRLGIDPERIAVGGGSAGGHLAASVATLPGLDTAQDDKSVSCLPNALVLFNPGTVMAPFPGLDLKGFGAGLSKEKLGCEPEEISPLHHVKKGTPPTVIFHGKADTTVPYSTVEKFAEVMKAAGNRCDLVGYEGEKHSFFNKSKFAETLAAADDFLVSLGYLPAKK